MLALILPKLNPRFPLASDKERALNFYFPVLAGLGELAVAPLVDLLGRQHHAMWDAPVFPHYNLKASDMGRPGHEGTQEDLIEFVRTIWTGYLHMDLAIRQALLSAQHQPASEADALAYSPFLPTLPFDKRCSPITDAPDPALVAGLLSPAFQRDPFLGQALQMKNRIALASIEATLFQLASNDRLTFYRPGGLMLVNQETREEAYFKLIHLAVQHRLLEDPAYTQFLIPLVGTERNANMIADLGWLDDQALRVYQLLGIHMQVNALQSSGL